MSQVDGKRRFEVWLDADLAARVLAVSERTGLPSSEVLRTGLRVLSAALLDWLVEGGKPVCVVCGTPRHPDHPDPLFDVLAHAQCDQIVANLERQLTS